MSTWPYMVVSKWDLNFHLYLEFSYVLLTLYGVSEVGFEPTPPFGVFLWLFDLIWWCQKLDSNPHVHLECSTWPYMVVTWWCQKLDSYPHLHLKRFLCLLDLIYLYGGVRSGIWIHTSVWSVLISIRPYMMVSKVGFTSTPPFEVFLCLLDLILWWCQKWDLNPHLHLRSGIQIYTSTWSVLISTWPYLVVSEVGFRSTPPYGVFLCLLDLKWWCQKWDSN